MSATRARRSPSKSSRKPVARIGTKPGGKPTVRSAPETEDGARGGLCPVVGVGASAGGFEAFREFLKALPRDTGFAFVLVQHLDPGHESMLTKLLSKATAMPVSEVKEGMAVEPNQVYVIPPNTTMSIKGGRLHLVTGRTTTAVRMPIDLFLRSLADDRGNHAIGVILSGTASDGTIGLKAIKAEGGITFAQDSKSAKYDGMPRSAIAAGCVDFVLPPEEIARELARIGRHPYVGAAVHAEAAAAAPIEGETELQKIFGLLRNASGVDFSYYKYTTIKRRILRRMVLHKSESLKQYLKYLHHNPSELEALYEDILIHVTGFFREPESFESLRDVYLAKILEGKARGEAIRVWVPGCSTGEEAYSVAIVLLEYLGDRVNQNPIQIFGTDISDVSIEKARAGFYSDGSLAEVGADRLRRFFLKSNGGYQITKSVREMCVFARQDLAKDPPFSKLDLISCRNVLIYMGSVLQKKVMSVFHYALKPNGYLILGKSESISGFADLFAMVDRKHKVYAKKSADVRPLFDLAAGYPTFAHEVAAKTEAPVPFDAQKEADRIILGQYAPAGLIVNENLQILHFRGQCSPYLAPPPGEASLSLLRMARPEFAVELRTAVHRARKQDLPARKEGIRVSRQGRQASVTLEVVPFKGHVGERYYLVLFKETGLADPADADRRRSAAASGRAGEMEIGRLQRELQTTKEYLQSIIEEQEATNEELKSANEEVLSSNEELQSTNEELETAKEELQSTNEELVTVNEQLQNRNAELAQVNDDLANLLSGVNIPIVMLGIDRCVRRFTPLAEKLLNLLPGDVGRPIENIRPNVDVPNLGPMITEVIDTVSPRQIEVQDREGRWYSLVVRPYRTLDNKIDGVVLVFIDIDPFKQAHLALQDEQKFSAAVLESAVAMVLVTELDGRIVRFNRACQQVTGYTFEEVKGRASWDLLLSVEERDQIKAAYGRIIADGQPVEHENHWIDKSGQPHLIRWANALMTDAAGTPRYIVRVGADITERRRMEVELQHSEAALRDSQAELRTLAAGLTASQESERKRLAVDLHDDVLQRLAALMLEVGSLQQALSEDRDALAPRLVALEDEMRGLAKDIRLTAHHLHPTVLASLGLGPGLRSLCDEIMRQYGIATRLTLGDTVIAVAGDQALCVYRVTQEALRNAATHSGAKEVVVTTESRGGILRLTVSDAGRGFDLDQARRKGMGLIAMEERVRQVGGTFTLTTAPGKGTRIDVEIPVGPSKAD
jgi:two-component system CheB/CheR fusion protein